MSVCTKCGERIDEGSIFCQNCGATIEKKLTVEALSKKGFISRIEQSIYFRIARGFAWFILILAVIALTISIIYFTPTVIDLIGGSTSVSPDEIKKAIDSEKTRKPFMFGSQEEEADQEKIDSELMAKLDKEIYDLISLLPEEIQRQWSVEGLRNRIKQELYHWKNLKSKIGIVKDARDLIKNFPEAERMNAIETYFMIKLQKENFIEQKQIEAKASLSVISAVILSLAALITSVTMILVLLAIERNTRKA